MMNNLSTMIKPNQNYNQIYNQNYNQNYSQSYTQNYNQIYNQNFNSNYHQNHDLNCHHLKYDINYQKNYNQLNDFSTITNTSRGCSSSINSNLNQQQSINNHLKNYLNRSLASNRFIGSNRSTFLNRSHNSNRSFRLNQNYALNKQNCSLNKSNGILNYSSSSSGNNQKFNAKTILNLIQKCFEQLNELKKERVSLLLNKNLNSANLLPSMVDQSNLEDVINFALEECNEIGKWLKENEELFFATNENFQTINYSFKCWFNQIQAVKCLSKKGFVELDLDRIGTNSVINSSFESGSSSIQSSVANSIQSSAILNDLQLYVELQQLIKSTRDVRKSIWCIAVMQMTINNENN